MLVGAWETGGLSGGPYFLEVAKNPVLGVVRALPLTRLLRVDL